MTRVRGGVVSLLLTCFSCGTETGGPDAGACEGVTWTAPAGCNTAAPGLEAKLRCVPGLTFSLTDAGASGAVRYELTLTQQLDPREPAAGSFTQRAVLDYVNADAPVVLYASGYHLSAPRAELTQAYGANQLSYEHRFFGPSGPADGGWSALTIENAAADAHHLVESLRWALRGPWLNTGGSKGGMTSLYHRRFYPCDVDATVAYVAPMTDAVEDPAYPVFLDAVGGAQWASCRAAITGFQRRLLEARDTLVPQQPGNFTYLGADRAFEMAVVEFPFAFWQYTAPDDPDYGCAAIPEASATAQAQLAFLQLHAPPDWLAGDESLAEYAAYYYQSAAQLGGPAPFEAHVSDLLRFPGANATPTFLIGTGVPTPPFDAAAMADITHWANHDAERVMLIYGEFDPWSAHPLTLANAVDSKVYVQAGGSHAARIGTLTAEQRTDALSMVSRWLGGRKVVNEPRRLQSTELEPRRPR